MSKVSDGYKYWVLYEGVPNGEINETDYWFGSIDDQIREIHEPFSGDLPAPEWIAFGDTRSTQIRKQNQMYFIILKFFKNLQLTNTAVVIIKTCLII